MRSRALYAYLLEAGVLNGTPEEIDSAKCNYRKLYKKRWKQQQQQRKELRIEVTITQYEAIKLQAHNYLLSPTAYARNTILESLGAGRCIPAKETLLEILQLISVAVIAFGQSPSNQTMSELIQRAETLLLTYLNQ
jgi:hypothetical protein